MNPGIIDLDIDEVKEGLASGDITLVDVREPQEYAGGHIPGSLSHPLSTFDPGELRGLARPDRVLLRVRRALGQGDRARPGRGACRKRALSRRVQGMGRPGRADRVGGAIGPVTCL